MQRKFLYHATHKGDLESILQEGLVRGASEGVPGGVDIPGVIWLDSGARGLRKWLNSHHPDDWVLLGIRRSYLDPGKLTRSHFYISRSGGGKKEKSTWYTYKGNIPRETIHVVG